MKFKLLLCCVLLCSTQVSAEAIDLREELNPQIDNEQVQVRTYTHQDDGSTITEYRSGGKVWMIKVQPAGDFPPLAHLSSAWQAIKSLRHPCGLSKAGEHIPTHQAAITHR